MNIPPDGVGKGGLGGTEDRAIEGEWSVERGIG